MQFVYARGSRRELSLIGWLGLWCIWAGPFSPCAALAAPFELKLDQGWVMKTGDNLAWACPDFVHSDWTPIQVGKPWEQAGFPGYDGHAWYRLELVIPEAWRKDPRVRESGEDAALVLVLGYVDDVDVTYFNGHQIGATGTMPPDYREAYDRLRKYLIPLDQVRWGQANVIAVRVYDGQRDGGIYSGPIRLRTPGLSDIIDLDFQVVNSDGIYVSPGPLPVRFKITNRSNTSYRLEFQCTLKSDRVYDEAVIDQRSARLQIGGKSAHTQEIRFTPGTPGFYQVTCSLSRAQDRAISKSMILGYDPEQIRPELTRESDFKGFWAQRKQELAAIDPAFKVTRSIRSNADLDVYLLEMRSLGNIRIRGWYTVPKTPGPHPAILSVPGYNGNMQPYMQRKHVATLSLNPRGHGNSKVDLDPQGRELMYIGFVPGKPEGYFYAGAYMDCVRAVDFLAARPEIDSTHIGVEGGSQGGGLSYATAALDERIMFCAPDIPWMGDWVGNLETSTWATDNYPKLMARIPGLDYEGINRFLSYFDSMNLAPWINCPVLMSAGLQDDVCPPRTVFAAYTGCAARRHITFIPGPDTVRINGMLN
jgi:cephalosporin-C deacetylase